MAITTVLNNVLNNSLKESFANSDSVPKKNVNMFVLLIVVTVYFMLVLLVGKYLWNECLCKAVTICKPITDIFTLLGIVIIIDMLHPRL